MPKVVLTMIVKDEKHVVTRALQSVLDLCDYFVIVDTGSTDGTQGAIKEFMTNRGKMTATVLADLEWKGFGESRNDAFRLAESIAGISANDYMLVLDADEVMKVPVDFNKEKLTKDHYTLMMDYHGMMFASARLFRIGALWEYKCPIHNFAKCQKEEATMGSLPELILEHIHDGARSKDPAKTAKDIPILYQALIDDPEHAVRYTFYLAQTYWELGEFQLALHYYQKRSMAGGWEEERWYAAYMAVRCLIAVKADWASVMSEAIEVFRSRPYRPEPLYQMARILREIGNYATGYMFAAHGATMKMSKTEGLYLVKRIYDFDIHDEMAVCAYHVGRYDECVDICNRLLDSGVVPEKEIGRVTKNRDMAFDKVAKSTP